MAKRRLTDRQLKQIQQAHERRRRQAGQHPGPTAAALTDFSLGPAQWGLVIANYGPTLIVEDQEGALYRCTVRQHLGALVCGDHVIWQAAGADEGVVIALEHRRSLLTRPDYSGRLKPVAANLDEVAIVVAPRPELDEFLIDRYLVAITAMGVDALLVLNKIDLLAAEKRVAITARLANYHRIGYPVLLASTRSAQGLEALCARLAGHTTLLAGQSGVGKSSLVKALLPHRDIRIRALSAVTGLGAHTTTTATLYHLPAGGDLIDTPGVRSFELGELKSADFEQGFIEFAPYLGRCRFADCRHTVEPGCALIDAVQKGEIDPRRLASYHQLKASRPRQ